MAAITPCLKGFLIALTTPLRSQFRLMIYTIQKIAEGQVAQILASVGRADIMQAVYKNSADQIDNFLQPIEQAMNLIPFEPLSSCPEGLNVLADTQNIYYRYKVEQQDRAYRIAQMSFASTYANQAADALYNTINKMSDVLDAIDVINLTDLTVGNSVMYYITNEQAIVTALPPGNMVSIQIISTGQTLTVPAGQIGRIG